MKILTDKKFKEEVKKAVIENPQIFQQVSRYFNFAHQKIKTGVDFDDAFANLCFSIIWRRARVFANANSILYSNDKLAEKNNWAYQLLDNKPNPFYDWRVARQLISMWLDYYGNAYLYTSLKGTYPNQAWVLPAKFVKPIIEAGLITKYKIEYEMNSFYIDAKEICHFKTIKPDEIKWTNNFYEGQPLLLQASVKSVGADKELIEYVQDYFLRDATVPFVLASPNNMTDDEFKRFKERWDTSLSQYKLAAMLEGGLDVKPLGTNQQANLGTLPQTDETILTRLGHIWGISPALITSNYNARATMEILKQEFYEDTIDPLLTVYEDTLSDHLRTFDTRIYLAHQKLSYTDPDTIFKNQIELFKAGILSRNEIRITQGLEPIKDGDIYLIQSNVTTIENITTPIVEPVKTIEPEKSIKRITAKSYFNSKWNEIPEEFKVYFWNKFDKVNKKHKEKIKQATARGFEKIHETINVNVWYENLKNIKAGISADIDLDFLDIESWEETLTKEVSPSVKALIVDVLEKSLAEVGEDFDENNFKEKIRKLLKNSTDKIKISANTAAEEVGRMIKEIIDENPMASKHDLLDKINDGVGNRFNSIYTQSRAELIAQTTATYSTGASQTMAWEGIDNAWLSMRDLKTRAAHAEADGQLRGEYVEGMFLVDGLECEFPGDTGDAGNDCNCRCSLFPIMNE